MCYCVLDLMLNISLAELFKGNHVISNELKCNIDGSYSIKILWPPWTGFISKQQQQ